MSNFNAAAAKRDMSGLIADWGKRCVISRFSGTRTGAARFSGTFVNTSSGTFWIQPKAGFSKRGDPGFLEETTHIMLSRTTASILAGDRVLASGDTVAYDVLIPEPQVHCIVSQLRLVKK